MSGQFYGTFRNSLHSKRVIIPKELKSQFSNEAENKIVQTIGDDYTIAIFPLDVWHALMKKFKNGTDFQRKVAKTLRTFAEAPQEIEPNGRIKLSSELMNLAKINKAKKVVIKGDGDYIRIWNTEAYENKINDLKEMFNRKNMGDELVL